VQGRQTIERIENGSFVVCRHMWTTTRFPAATQIIQLRTTRVRVHMPLLRLASRARIYQMSCRGRLEIWRNAPDFNQRYVGTISDDEPQSPASGILQDGKHWRSTSTSRSGRAVTEAGRRAVDDYIAAAPKAAQPQLRQLRTTIRSGCAESRREDQLWHTVLRVPRSPHLLRGLLRSTSDLPAGDGAPELKEYLSGPVDAPFPNRSAICRSAG